MQIESSRLLQYTIKKEVQTTSSACLSASVDDIEITSTINVSDYELAIDAANAGLENINIVSKINYIPTDTVEINGKTSDITNVSSVLSNESISNTVDLVINPPENTTKPTTMSFSSTYKDLSQSTINRIKQIIYDLHHKTSGGTEGGDGTGGTGGTGGTEGGDGTGGTGGTGGTEGGDGSDGPELEEPDPNKKSFINEFNDTTSMFEYLNSLDSSITAESGITRAQLIALTQNDSWEDSNYDFFGSLNRIFDVLDEDDNSTLSFEEIKEFIGDEIGNSIVTYKNKVNTYAAEIQNKYVHMSDQEKLEFVLKKTEEYLKAAGLTMQLNALNKLKSQTDLHNSIKVGNIAMANLNNDPNAEFFTLGSYTFKAGQFQYEVDGYPQDVTIWANDKDTADDDLGITLDISLLSKNWYELVDVMVHELTHATASQFYTASSDPNEAASLNLDNVKTLYDMGFIDLTEYNYYNDNWVSIVTNGQQDDINRLFYLASCAWGEYMAYQTDADYVDSIAGDEYDAGRLTTAVDGSNEKQTIIDHIDAAYNTEGWEQKFDSEGNPMYDEHGDPILEYVIHNEAVPDWKWWTYA